MQVADTRSQLSRQVCPSYASRFTPLEKKGRREDRAPAGTHKNPHAN